MYVSHIYIYIYSIQILSMHLQMLFRTTPEYRWSQVPLVPVLWIPVDPCGAQAMSSCEQSGRWWHAMALFTALSESLRPSCSEDLGKPCANSRCLLNGQTNVVRLTCKTIYYVYTYMYTGYMYIYIYIYTFTCFFLWALQNCQKIVVSSISGGTAKLTRLMKWGLVSQKSAPWQPCNGAELAVFVII